MTVEDNVKAREAADDVFELAMDEAPNHQGDAAMRFWRRLRDRLLRVLPSEPDVVAHPKPMESTKTLGQVAYDAVRKVWPGGAPRWDDAAREVRDAWEVAATAVAAEMSGDGWLSVTQQHLPELTDDERRAMDSLGTTEELIDHIERGDHHMLGKWWTWYEARREIERLRVRLGCVVRNCRNIDDTIPRDEPGPLCGPTWAKVSRICGLGSTSAIELCRQYGVDPHFDCAKEDKHANE